MSQNWKPERTNVIDDALTLEWYAGDAIVAYILADMSLEVLQTWSDAALDVLRNWPPDRPYLALYDLSRSGIVLGFYSLARKRMCSLGITKEGEERALDCLAQRQNPNARVALYISMSYSGHLGGFLTRADARKMQSSQIEYEAFYSQEAALNWLDAAVQT
jgi:hypothetical protein